MEEHQLNRFFKTHCRGAEGVAQTAVTWTQTQTQERHSEWRPETLLEHKVEGEYSPVDEDMFRLNLCQKTQTNKPTEMR